MMEEFDDMRTQVEATLLLNMFTSCMDRNRDIGFALTCWCVATHQILKTMQELGNGDVVNAILDQFVVLLKDYQILTTTETDQEIGLN